MTLFLARVTGPKEAELAVAHGADCIELADVAPGPSGAFPTSVMGATIAAVAGRRPTGVMVDASALDEEGLTPSVASIAEAGVDYVTIALPSGPSAAEFVRALAAVATRIRIVGLILADQGVDNGLLSVMATSGFSGAMLSVAAGSPRGHTSILSLKRFVDSCHASGLTAGLGGALEPPDIPRLLLLAPDYLGFRKALCLPGISTESLDPAAFDVIRGLIPIDPRSPLYGTPKESKVDYRLVAGRSAMKGSKEPIGTDRVFVRDFVVPVRIGAYEREQEKPQDIRFNIDVKVARPSGIAADMRDVFSYDVILDGIRMLVAQEHIALIETLAERIAALLLSDPRVQEVVVRAEKLDVGPGAVGVEIRRERPAEAADVHRLFTFSVRDGDPNAAE